MRAAPRVRACACVRVCVCAQGTLEPEMLLELAARNNLPPPFASVEDARAAYNFKDLQVGWDGWRARFDQHMHEHDATSNQARICEGCRAPAKRCH